MQGWLGRAHLVFVTLARGCRAKGPGIRDSSRARQPRRAGMTNRKPSSKSIISSTNFKLATLPSALVIQDLHSRACVGFIAAHRDIQEKESAAVVLEYSESNRYFNSLFRN